MITNKENNMIRTQIQLTPEQVRWLKRRAAMEKKSVADLIRTSLDEMMRETIFPMCRNCAPKRWHLPEP